ncbi:hypothetical protein AgCh_000518 [Apium graveolens]
MVGNAKDKDYETAEQGKQKVAEKENEASDMTKKAKEKTECKSQELTFSSMKSSFGKPFFKRRFSFGSKGTKSPSENHTTRKSGLFWSKSSKK